MGLLDATEHLGETESESDEEVLARSIRFPSAFALIVDRYESAFLRKAMSYVRSKEEAEDIVQEAFAKIYLHAGKFRTVEGASFKSWAYRILINTSITHYQKRKREGHQSVELEPEHFESLPDTLSQTHEHEELREYVLSVLSRLPDQFARILHLHFVEGKPHKEIADQEGLSVPAVKTRVHRAKKEFRKVAERFDDALTQQSLP